MEIKKLRIGNTIMALGWDENSGGQIVGDPEGNEVVKVDMEILNSIHKGNDITIYEPIRLNEEWIKKLGFKLDEDCNGYRKDKGRKSFLIYLDDGYGNMMFLHQEDIGCGFEDLNVEIESVDELENLYFFLMQEELSF